MTMAPVWEANKKVGFSDLREARFHQWANEYEEFESGPGNYTVALVEYADGSIGTVMPDCIRFLDGEEATAARMDEAIASMSSLVL
jgi:sugar lactone lactonase YvrE